MPKFGHFQIAHKIWGRLNVWNGRYVDLAGKRGLFALLDRSRYVMETPTTEQLEVKRQGLQKALDEAHSTPP